MVKKMIITLLLTCLTGTFVQVQAQDNPFITLEAYDLPGYFATHAGTGGPVAVLTKAGDQTDAGKFYLVAGLADPEGISFESVEFPGYYLRHRDYVVRLESDTTDLFNNDATWTLRPGLADPEAVSFESTAGFVGNYLIHDPTSPYGLRMGPVATNGAATWKLPADDPKAKYPQPADGALHSDLWVNLGWTPGDYAVSHDVYLGDNFDDVNDGAESTFRGNQVTTNLITGIPGFAYPDGLTIGTTYYWRIDEVNDLDPNSPWKGDVWSFTVPPRTAYEPKPHDGAKLVDPNVELNWTAGFGARLHYVYFGDNFDDVNNAADGLPLSETTYTPGTLELEKVYYWRVDEFDAVTTNKGDVWSFRTLPVIPISDPNLVGWWKLDAGYGALAVDWSGQNNHGAIMGNAQWVAGYDGGALKLDGSDDYVVLPIGSVIESLASSTITTWVDFSNAGGAWQRIFDFGSNTTVNMFLTPRTGSSGPMRFAITIGGSGAEEQATAPDTLLSGWHHVAVTINTDTRTITLYLDGEVIVHNTSATLTPHDLGKTNNNWLGRSQYSADGYFRGSLDDFRIYNYALSQAEVKETMRGDPLLAWGSSPANESTPYIKDAMPLSWSAGDNASQHDVYFGIDKNAVADADESDTTGIYRGRQGVTIYTPPEVEWGGGPYYWRVDEYNIDATISKGNLWSFTVTDFILIDDIEDYNDYPPDEIFSTWIDGWEVPTNGSLAGHADPPFAETGNVHGGSQSMPVYYENNFKYSEITMTLVSVRDWTEEGVGVLSLWFYGDAANAAERMYVNLNGIATVYHDNSDAALIEEWTEWAIDLQEFAAKGVNLSNVNTISIGFGDKNNLQAGGSGMVLFDDIRLYRPPAP